MEVADKRKFTVFVKADRTPVVVYGTEIKDNGDLIIFDGGRSVAAFREFAYVVDTTEELAKSASVARAA